MKPHRRRSGTCVVSTWLVCLAACAGGTKDDGAAKIGDGQLRLREGRSLDSAAECGVDLPACAEGLTCISFELDGAANARCLDAAEVCQTFLTCGPSSECILLESYPSRVSCSGAACSGSHCDDAVSSP